MVNLLTRKSFCGLSVFLWVVLSAVMVSCNDSQGPQPPVDPEEKEYIYILKGESISHFGHATLNSTSIDLCPEDIHHYFGDRVSLATAKRVEIRNDSVFMYKSHGILEKYKMELPEDLLRIYDEQSDTWKVCAMIDEKGSLFLTVNFYVNTVQSGQRFVRLTGHEYSLSGYRSMSVEQSDTTSDIIWLRMQYEYEKVDL